MDRIAWQANGGRRDVPEVAKYLEWRLCDAGSAAWQATHEEVVRAKAAAKAEDAAEQPRGETGKFAVLASNEGENGGRDYAAEQERKSAARLGALVGVGRNAVEKGERIWRHDPTRELAKAVARGLLKATEALRRVKKAETAEKAAALPAGRYRVIYADPPWSYNDARQTGDHRESTGALHHYSTMSNEELLALDVASIAAEDAVLFCWATFPLLPFALDLVKAWGFAYKTAFVWDKGSGAFGSYHNAAGELLLVAVRGSCTPDVDEKFDQIQAHPRARHSAKPEAWRAMIDAMYPHGPRIELFRRGAAPLGWQVWGAEAAA